MTPHVKKILITGGSGMIGTRLTALLQSHGDEVIHLGRTRRDNGVKTFLWNPDRDELEDGALNGVDAIVHLAGAGIADKRWTPARKRTILQSRIKSTALLKSALDKQKNNVSAVIAASAIGYYGFGDSSRVFLESDAPATDFVAGVSAAWEEETTKFRKPGLRLVTLRIGVVLSPEGGALEKLKLPVTYFAGAPLGDGEQYVSWVHLDDLCFMFIKALEDTQMSGVYNAVSPDPVTNRELTGEIAHALGKPLWLPNVPGFVVKLIAGGVAQVVLNGARVSCEKMRRAGYSFRFPTLKKALEDLLEDHAGQ